MPDSAARATRRSAAPSTTSASAAAWSSTRRAWGRRRTSPGVSTPACSRSWGGSGTEETMAITRDEVRRIAELARLEIPEARLERMAAELSQVLDFAATLNRLDLQGLEPSQFAPAGAPLREDTINGRRL